MYKAKSYHDWNKVFKKYVGRWCRHNVNNIAQVCLIVNLDEDAGKEIHKQVKRAKMFGKFAEYFEARLYNKLIRFEDGDDGLATIKGYNMTNLGVFYIMDYKGELGQVHANYLSFLTNPNTQK